MKKLLLIPLAVLLVGVGFIIHQPQTKIVKQVVTSVKTQTVQAQAPVYRVGDTQGGITLTAVYLPATPSTGGGILPQFMLVAVELSGVQLDSSSKLALIYTSDNQYVQPHGEAVRECSNCAVFLIPRTAKVDAFIYQDYQWLL